MPYDKNLPYACPCCGYWNGDMKYDYYKHKEPLIKDEKIRKAVRVWAEAVDVSEVMVAHLTFDTTTLASISDASKQISFSNERAFLPRGKNYTIAELCGEEEE